MIVVLDTNVLLQALNQRHPFAVILHSWHAGQFTWAVSTDILLEYQEVIIRESGPGTLADVGAPARSRRRLH